MGSAGQGNDKVAGCGGSGDLPGDEIGNRLSDDGLAFICGDIVNR